MIKRVYLEITDVCNLNCPFCTNSKGNYFMDFETIKDHLIKIKEVCNYVYLHVLGEPLLHPQFEQILAICSNIELNVQLVTNGTLLKNYPDILKHKCLRKLSVSLHSINNTKVDQQYFDYIDRLIDSIDSQTLELRFYDSDNLNPTLKAYLDSLYLKYNVKDTDRYNSYKLKNNVYIYYSKLFKWPDILDPYISSKGKCLGALSQIAILHNSDVTLCCLDPKGHNKIGNLKKNTLKSILESDEYKLICSNFRNNKLTKELCSKCSYRLRFDEKNN